MASRNFLSNASWYICKQNGTVSIAHHTNIHILPLLLPLSNICVYNLLSNVLGAAKCIVCNSGQRCVYSEDACYFSQLLFTTSFGLLLHWNPLTFAALDISQPPLPPILHPPPSKINKPARLVSIHLSTLMSVSICTMLLRFICCQPPQL